MYEENKTMTRAITTDHAVKISSINSNFNYDCVEQHFHINIQRENSPQTNPALTSATQMKTNVLLKMKCEVPER